MATSNKNKGKSRSRFKIFIGIFLLMMVLIAVTLYFYNEPGATFFDTPKNEVEYIDIEEDAEKTENGIHIRTGFIVADGMQEVINNCTNCHSAKLVTQNRMSKDGWTATIRWMQKTQNLWDLGENEGPIVDYLAKNYGPINKGRREGLKDIKWYPLK